MATRRPLRLGNRAGGRTADPTRPERSNAAAAVGPVRTVASSEPDAEGEEPSPFTDLVVYMVDKAGGGDTPLPATDRAAQPEEATGLLPTEAYATAMAHLMTHLPHSPVVKPVKAHS